MEFIADLPLTEGITHLDDGGLFENEGSFCGFTTVHPFHRSVYKLHGIPANFFQTENLSKFPVFGKPSVLSWLLIYLSLMHITANLTGKWISQISQ